MNPNNQKKTEYNTNKLMKKLRHATGNAIADFGMIEEGDKIMVCMSGGKDSYVLLEVLQSLQHSAPVHFELIPVHLEAGLPNYPHGLVEDYLKTTGLNYHVVHEDVYKIIRDKIPDGRQICSLCARLRRGILYRVASEIGATKVALGHHADDILETFFLNLFYAGRIKAMPAKLKTDDGKHVLIRPLAYCREKDIAKFAQAKGYPLLPKDMCSLGENKMRPEVKDMIKAWDKKYPGRSEIMFKAMKDITLSHMLDTNLYDFSFADPDAPHEGNYRVVGTSLRDELRARRFKSGTPQEAFAGAKEASNETSAKKVDEEASKEETTKEETTKEETTKEETTKEKISKLD